MVSGLGFLSDAPLIAAQAHTRRLYLVQRGNREQCYCKEIHIHAHFVEHAFLLGLTIYVCLILQPYMLSKRMTTFRVLIVT